MYKKYVAVDQYGQTHFVDHPRKELMNLHGVKHADKMYRDTQTGGAVQVGYVISGHWYEVMKISPMNEED
jgi:hypothetical protein